MIDLILFSPPFASEATDERWLKHTPTYMKKFGYAAHYDKKDSIARLKYG